MGRFGEFLRAKGRLSAEGLAKAMDMQKAVGGRLGTNILELGLLGEGELLAALGEFHRSQTATAAQLLDVPQDTLNIVPPQIARRHHFIPIEHRGHTLTLAARGPLDPLVQDEVGYLTSCLVRTVVALEVRLDEALAKHYQVPQPTRLSGLARRLDGQPAAAEKDDDVGPSAPAPAEPPAAAPKPVPSFKPRAAVAPPPPSEPEIRYIELDSEEEARIYQKGLKGRSPGQRLATASEELQRLSIRDEIGDVMLDFSRPYLERRLLLVRRSNQVVGWRGEGEGVDAGKLRKIAIGSEVPSVFLSLAQGTEFWLGTLAPLPAHQSLFAALGGPAPKDCLVLPVTLRSRQVCYLYGDNRDAGVSSAPLAELRRLAIKAGVAFEVSILKNKIRTL